MTKGTKRTIGPTFVILSLPCFILSLCIFGKFSRRHRHTYSTGTTFFLYGVPWSLAVQVMTTILTEHYITEAIFPVKELNIDLLIRHTPSLCDAIDVSCFQVPPLSLLTSCPNCVKLERLPSVKSFLTVFFLIWMELLLFKTFINSVLPSFYVVICCINA